MARPKTHNDKLAGELITAAREIITANGLDSLNLRSLASDCDTSTAAIYSLFNGKDAVITEVIIQVFREFIDAQAAIVLSDNPDRDLQELALLYREWAHNNPHIYMALYQGHYTGTAYVDSLIDEALQPWYIVVEEAREQGLTTDDIETLIFRIWQTLHGGVMLELGNTLVPDEDLLLSAVAAQIHYSSGKAPGGNRAIHPGEVPQR